MTSMGIFSQIRENQVVDMVIYKSDDNLSSTNGIL